MKVSDVMSSFSTELPVSQSAPPRLRLEFLDGLRGLTALYVVLFHAYQMATFDDPRVDAALVWRIGHPAVSVFIVLSGFCLMLPVVRSSRQELRGGALEFLKRRARRILPPYYAALAISAVFLAAAHLAKYRQWPAFQSGDWADPVLARHLSAGSLLSHAALVHNVSPAWFETIDVPMWSVATEWQIYFFLPALLLPVWRRYGIAALLAAGFIIGLMPHYLLPAAANFDWACPWYLGLFATGMAGAVLAFTPCSALRTRRLPWGMIAGGLFVLLGALVLVPDRVIGNYVWQTDALTGAAAICLILHGSIQATSQQVSRSFAVHMLESRPALWLGAFSYSLYLVHYPLLNKCALFFASRPMPFFSRVVLMYAIGLPLALGLSYLFHLVFEKRFTAGGPAQIPEVVLK
jgi:peptidoglycan/LPS O-acetylase OafA/YrhL